MKHNQLIKKLFLVFTLSLFSNQSFAEGCPDGSEPVKSISDDGTYFVYNCGGSNTANSSASSQKLAKALAGIDIENDPNLDFFRPPLVPIQIRKLMGGTGGLIADFNNDGLADVIYTGLLHLNLLPECTYRVCSDQVQDDAKKIQPALYLSSSDGKLNYSPELVIDNRLNKGMVNGWPLLADYNNDKVLDIYIADQGVGRTGKITGYRDSYYLSQPNGTWLESSKTHLSNSNFKEFNHGGATGDIDNDGDMDIVLTAMSAGLWCLMNDGSGFFKKRQCGGSFLFALELADMDNDGDLDILAGGHEYEAMFTGIYWNDGLGNFMPYDATPLKQYKDIWGGIPEVAASDLDNDGDIDIVYSRVRNALYEGAAIQIIENLGNKKFKDHGIMSLDDSTLTFIKDIRFRDLDKDGDLDLYLVAMEQYIDGTVFINNGDFNFLLIMPPEAYKLYGALGQNGRIQSINDREKKAKLAAQLKKINDEKKIQEKEKAKLIAELKKSQEKAKAKRLAKERENRKNNFKYSSRNFKPQLKLLETQSNLAVCNAISKEFYAGDYYSQTNKETYLFVSIDSNGWDCHYEWSRNENNALRRCKQNNETDGKCTIYALGDNIVWGDPELYKELTGRD